MDFLKRYILLLILLGFAGICCVYWFYWHLKPFTPNAFVFANTRPVSAWVEGYITEIFVKNNQFVRKGDILFTVFEEPYRLKTGELECRIAAVDAELQSREAAVEEAQEEINRWRAEFYHAQYLFVRAVEMFRTDAVSEDYVEEQLRYLRVSQAQYAGAGHRKTVLIRECRMLRHKLDELRKELELQLVWLEKTAVRALSDGYVTNMSISPGGYCRPGEVLFSFIDSSEWFVQANFTESELSQLREGVKARIWLWQYPGKLWHGVICKTGWGVERRKSSPVTGIAEVEKENEWFLLPQRYPVQIRITDPDPEVQFHIGASAYVELDIPSHPVRQFFWELFLWE